MSRGRKFPKRNRLILKCKILVRIRPILQRQQIFLASYRN
jgi:hypothetical protein